MAARVRTRPLRTPRQAAQSDIDIEDTRTPKQKRFGVFLFTAVRIHPLRLREHERSTDMKQTLKAGFLKGAAATADFPESPFPEIAFVGRSNVGKSSLLNFVVRDRAMAKVSATPGKTQQINFFPVESKWMFVDVPGFGYAKVSRDEREKWSALVWEYLLHREQLALVCVLVDSRHDPQPIDLQCIEMLELNQRPYIIVLTKIDKIKEAHRKERAEQIGHLVSQCAFCRGVVLFSTVEKLGRDHVIGAVKRATENWQLPAKSGMNDQ